jgi:hypothetical protein
LNFWANFLSIIDKRSGKPVPKSEQVGGELKKTLSLNDNVSKHNTCKETERKTTFHKSEKSNIEPINTVKEISKVANVSHDTIAKVKKNQYLKVINIQVVVIKVITTKTQQFFN